MVRIIHLNIKFKTIFLEDNRRENLGDLGFGDHFLDTHIKNTIHERKSNVELHLKTNKKLLKYTVNKYA